MSSGLRGSGCRSTTQRSKTTAFAYTNGNLSLVTSPLGLKTSFAYDATGRRTSMVEPRGNVAGGNPAQYTTTYGYDNGDRLTSLTTPLGHASQWAFDDAGRLISVTDAGRLISVTDANNHVTSYAYDDANHLVSVTAPDPDGAGPLSAPVTGYGYDAAYNLTSRTDANNHTTSHEVDDAGRQVAMITPLGKRWSYSYDPSSNLTSVVDANGNATGTPGDGTTSLGYDQLDRLTTIDYSDATPDVTLAYDASSNRVSLSDGLAGAETRSYDLLERLSSVARGGDTIDYLYDAAGNLIQRSYPGGVITGYSFDDDSRLATVVANGATTSYGYDAAGNATTITLPSGNGHVETRVFDRSGRLTEVQNKKGSTVLSRFQLTLDPVGNPTQIVRSGTPAETRKYLYDNLDRLTEVCFQSAACTSGSSPFIRWTYDGAGNRLTENRPSGVSTTYSYDNDDRLLTAGATSYTFDHNGNQTQAGARTFVWDLANRLVSTTLSGTTTSYSYTGDGRRVSASTGAGAGNTTGYLWDVAHNVPQVALERDGAGTLLRRYTYGLDRLALSTSSASFYYHYDDLRSVANLTNASGAKQWTYAYEPYGTLKSQTQNSGSAPANSLKFTGEQHDPTGLIHLRARQYDPTTGRFTSRDPLDETRGGSAVTPYGYVYGRPTVFVDPSGMLGCPRRVCRPVENFADSIAASPPAMRLKYALEGLSTAPGRIAARLPVSAQTDTGDAAASPRGWGQCTARGTLQLSAAAVFLGAGGVLFVGGIALEAGGGLAALSAILRGAGSLSEIVAPSTIMAAGGALLLGGGYLCQPQF